MVGQLYPALVIVALGGLVARAGPHPPAGVGREIAPPRPRVQAIEQSCTGFVVAVGRDFITVQGEKIGPPQRFAVCPALAAGRYIPGINSAERYGLSDVALGDIVGLRYDRIDDVDVCQRLWVRRRPGGRIPPARDPDPRDSFPPHELFQAYQDFEEKGTPLPERFTPTFYKTALPRQ